MPQAVPTPRVLLLLLVFFCICCGLGYPSLNRVDWRTPPGGLADIPTYRGMVTASTEPAANPHMKFRILVPYLARPVYRMAKDHVGTWDPIMFSLLAVNSLLVALTAVVLLIVVFHELGDYPVALGSALIFLLNFAVPNLRLSGFIDAGEGFCLMLLVWSLARRKFWTLPLVAALGATAKESFVPFLVVFTLTWWLTSRKSLPRAAVIWIGSSWLVAMITLMTVQWAVTGSFQSPLRFGLDLRGDVPVVGQLLRSFADRNLWYIFFWLLPLSLLRLKHLPRNWRVATEATAVSACALNTYYGGAPGTIGRALFSIAGPLLSAAVAILLFTGVESQISGKTN